MAGKGFPLAGIAQAIVSVVAPEAAPVLGLIAGQHGPAQMPNGDVLSAGLQLIQQANARPAPRVAMPADLSTEARLAALEQTVGLQAKQIADLTHALQLSLAGHALAAGVDPRTVLQPREGD